MGKKDKTKTKSKAKAVDTKKGKNGKAPKAPKVKAPKLDLAGQAQAVIDDPASTKKAIKAARHFLAELDADASHAVAAAEPQEVAAADPVVSEHDTVDGSGPESDAAIKARVAAKKLLRKRFPDHSPEPDDIDRADGTLVAAYNLTLGVERGSYLSSDAEVAKAVESTKAPKKGKVTKEDLLGRQVVEQIETEKGREFAVGSSTTTSTGGTSLDVGALVGAEESNEVERDHFGRPYIEYLNDKDEVKRKAYTRVTTYIDCLEDKTQLDKWKLRTLLEGAGLDLADYMTDEQRDIADSLVGQAHKVTVAHEKALAKIAKRQAKGELELGQFGLLEAEAKKAHNDALNTLATTALDLGGVHDRAQKGTDLHAWTERYDRSGLSIDDFVAVAQTSAEYGSFIDAVTEADLRAYAAKMTELGIEHVAIEQLVVVDELGVAGTLDRASLFKFPGQSRRVRCVADIKTGRIDFSAGKIGMQLFTYASGKAYDHTKATVVERRSDLKLSRTKALLIHLPQGEARCEVYVVDIELAAQGVRLARDVREWRNTGKRVYNTSTPLAGA